MVTARTWKERDWNTWFWGVYISPAHWLRCLSGGVAPRRARPERNNSTPFLEEGRLSHETQQYYITNVGVNCSFRAFHQMNETHLHHRVNLHLWDEDTRTLLLVNASAWETLSKSTADFFLCLHAVYTFSPSLPPSLSPSERPIDWPRAAFIMSLGLSVARQSEFSNRPWRWWNASGELQSHTQWGECWLCVCVFVCVHVLK